MVPRRDLIEPVYTIDKHESRFTRYVPHLSFVYSLNARVEVENTIKAGLLSNRRASRSLVETGNFSLQEFRNDL